MELELCDVMDVRQDAGDCFDCLVVKLVILDTQLGVLWIVIVVKLIQQNYRCLEFLAIVLKYVLVILLGPLSTNLLRFDFWLVGKDMLNLTSF